MKFIIGKHEFEKKLFSIKPHYGTKIFDPNILFLVLANNALNAKRTFLMDFPNERGEEIEELNINDIRFSNYGEKLDLQLLEFETIGFYNCGKFTLYSRTLNMLGQG